MPITGFYHLSDLIGDLNRHRRDRRRSRKGGHLGGRFLMLHPLEQVRDHQNPLADPPALASRHAPQLCRPRFAAKEVCRHRPSPKHGTLAASFYHIWGSAEAGITYCSASAIRRRSKAMIIPATIDAST